MDGWQREDIRTVYLIVKNVAPAIPGCSRLTIWASTSWWAAPSRNDAVLRAFEQS